MAQQWSASLACVRPGVPSPVPQRKEIVSHLVLDSLHSEGEGTDAVCFSL